MRRAVRWLTLALLVACRSAAPARDPVIPAEWRVRAVKVDTAAAAMVSSNDSLATLTGVEILRRGGNAIDATVAVAFAMAVTYPEAGNLGGGGFALVRLTDGRITAIDFREKAPRAATRDMYLDSTGAATRASIEGHLASGVPGTVAGLAALLDRHGTLPLREVVAPALRLATEGFRVDSALARSLRDARSLLTRQAAASPFFAAGAPVPAGTLLVQPDLARTLRLIAEGGAAAFYRGAIADSLVAEMRRGGGIITHEDLAAYAPEWREPLRGSYRGHTIVTMPPSSSGGIALIETLNMLEALGAPPRFGSSAQVHRLAESLRRSFLDRNDRLGDPAFVANPVERLTSKEYARELARGIEATRASPTLPLASNRAEGTETTHISIVDARGNAVALTYTINDLYGSGVWVRGAGFILNDEMDDFAARPGRPNLFGLVQGERNAIAPGKRMLSSMTPTMVLDSSGAPLLILGSRGGPRIITSVLQVISNVLDHGMSLPAAVAAPRIHHQALPDSLRYEASGLRPTVIDSLRAMGHAIGPAPWQPGGYVGRVHAIMRTTTGWVGVVDPRTSGLARGM